MDGVNFNAEANSDLSGTEGISEARGYILFNLSAELINGGKLTFRADKAEEFHAEFGAVELALIPSREVRLQAGYFKIFRNGGAGADVGDAGIERTVQLCLHGINSVCWCGGNSGNCDIGRWETQFSGKFLPVLHGAANVERASEHGISNMQISLCQMPAYS